MRTYIYWLWKAISIFIPLVTFLFLIGLVAVELTPLGPRFRLLIFIVPAAALISTILTKTLPPIRLRKRRAEDPPTRRRGRESLAISALLSIMLIVAVIIMPTTIERLSRTDDARAALSSFAIQHDPAVSPDSLELTLAEFERARRSLAEEWTVPPEIPPVSLQLLPDIEAYRQLRNESWSTGFALCEESGAKIVVPVEITSGVLDEYHHSGTPTHEMAHGMMCQILGQRAFLSIQLWFHEGIAQLYQNQGMTKLFDRAFNRAIVWWKRDALPPPEKFCDYDLREPGADIELFYQTALEFVRSLEASHGRRTLNATIEDVSEGDPFDHSLKDRLGGVCPDLYAEWTESL